MRNRLLGLAAFAVVAVPASAQPADVAQPGRFDNGKMWTFDQPPIAYFQQEYGFTPDAAWFEKARLGALRIPGCSASFVSGYGLVMTNHHCGRGHVQQMSRRGEDLVQTGFVARNLADERKAESMYADQLVAIDDVTAEVDAALAGRATSAERAQARQAAFQTITQRMQGQRGAGYVVQVISLYNGSKYSAYTFKRYSDVRLVMAPELQLGYFGGDPDNFTYPRYALDMTFFRVYENNQPLRPQHFFRWSAAGTRENEPVFVIGNPGSTNRLEAGSLLEWRRDVQEKEQLAYLRETMRAVWAEYERTRNPALLEQYFGLSNSEKLYTGRVKGLNDAALMRRRAAAEASFRQSSPAGAVALDSLAALQTQKRQYVSDYQAFAGFTVGGPYTSATLSRAMIALMPGLTPQQRAQALARVPAQSREYDEALLAARIARFVAAYGADDATLPDVDRSPEVLARTIIGGSSFANPEQATAFVTADNVPATDLAVRYVAKMMPRFLAFQQNAASFNARQADFLADLGRARFAQFGYNEPPDATFSLRMADGRVAGYTYNGTTAPAYTTFHGLYDRYASFKLRSEGAGDWNLPQRWLNAPASFDRNTPMNLVATTDIIGGNSGSAMLNRNLEVVGLVFDGNIESLPSSFIYAPETFNRAVAVDSRGMLEALDDVYDLDRVVLELSRGQFVATEAAAKRALAPTRTTPARRTTTPARRPTRR